MTLVAVEAIPYRLPTRRPVRFANGEVHQAEHVLVRLRTDDGRVGIGEASPRSMTYGDTAVGVAHAVRALIAPHWIGEDETRIAFLHGKLKNLVWNPTARAALDVALWDLLGQRCGLPIAQLLGGAQERVAVAHLLGLDRPESMAQEARRFWDELGVRAFKVKVGEDIDIDVARATAVREALGSEALLYLDANHGWSASASLTAISRMQDTGVDPAWVEEPCPARQQTMRQWLVERLSIPVVGDESATDLEHARAELLARSCQWVSVKAGRSGFSEARRIAHLVHGFGGEVVVGSQIEGALGVYANLHLAAGLEEASFYPAELTASAAYVEDVVDPPPVVDGRMAVPTAPGLGVVIDEARLNALRL
ncbi:MAG: enolase C-terminal domain-like protein [Myxococcota bacterium]